MLYRIEPSQYSQPPSQGLSNCHPLGKYSDTEKTLGRGCMVCSLCKISSTQLWSKTIVSNLLTTNLVPRVCLFAGYVVACHRHNPRTGILWERDWLTTCVVLLYKHTTRLRQQSFTIPILYTSIVLQYCSEMHHLYYRLSREGQIRHFGGHRL
jgi:hypothetical protein